MWESTYLWNTQASAVYPDLRIRAQPLAKRRVPDSTGAMIQPGFLDPESRRDLIELANDGSVAHRLARRANALVLLGQGMSCSDVAKVPFLDDDAIHTWYRLYPEDGFDGLVSFGYDGGACRLSDTQQDKLRAWITETQPQTTDAVGAWINEFVMPFDLPDTTRRSSRPRLVREQITRNSPSCSPRLVG
jgi:transposase